MRIALEDCLNSAGVVTQEFRLSGKRVSLVLDRSFPTQEYIYRHVSAGFGYETEAVEALMDCLREGDTFIDVGANCGYFTAIGAALVGESGRVISIEPDEKNFRCLTQNAPYQCELWQGVVSDKDGCEPFYINLDNDGGHALWDPAAHPFNTKTADVATIKVLKYSRRLDHWKGCKPRAIKIDTEGAELRVLRGAEKILSQSTLKLVVCERNAFGLAQLGATEAEVEDLMKAHGFTSDEDYDATNVSNWIFKRKD